MKFNKCFYALLTSGALALSGCGDGSNKDVLSNGEVTLEKASLVDVTANNAHAYSFSGECLKDGEKVVLTVNKAAPQQAPTCIDGTWTAMLDLTGLNQDSSLDVTVAITGSSADSITTVINNTFICPDNFVGVSPLNGYTSQSFCAMKYEASLDSSGNAVSAAVVPFKNSDSLDRTEITRLCTNNGFDLISNDEWQTIARNIESVETNWGNSQVGDALGLSRGHHGDPNGTISSPSSDDALACVGTVNPSTEACNLNTWNVYRRTSTLTNGDIIWDLSGNVWELVKDNISSVGDAWGSTNHPLVDFATAAPVSGSFMFTGVADNQSRTIAEHFGPAGTYANLTPDSDGIGQLYPENLSVEELLRGSASTDTSAGIFAAGLGYAKVDSGTADNEGFRCVYRP